MAEMISERAAAWLAALPALAKDVAFLAGIAAPVAAFFVALIVYGCKKSCRTRSKRWFLYLSAIGSLLTAAFARFAFAAPAPSVWACAVAFALELALYGALCLYRGRAPKEKKRKKKRRPALPEEFFEEETSPSAASAAEALPSPEGEGKPRLVRCFAGAQEPRPLRDVRLDYVLSVAERLRSLPLGAGDRLEAEKMSDLLQIYQNKGALSREECAALNDILAALLKMMAKYDA